MGQSCTNRAGSPWRCGQRAALALDDMLGARTVRCDRRGEDRYGRVLASCRVGDTDVNAWLVEQGWAVAYRRYSVEYVPQEDRARAAGRGIWAGPFDEPEAWRIAHPRR